jgi:hypothetical protein
MVIMNALDARMDGSGVLKMGHASSVGLLSTTVLNVHHHRGVPDVNQASSPLSCKTNAEPPSINALELRTSISMMEKNTFAQSAEPDGTLMEMNAQSVKLMMFIVSIVWMRISALLVRFLRS